MMAITSVGYGGTINEVQMATTAGFFAAEYGVLGANAWKVSAAAGMDRGVAIAPGTGYGHFVTVTSDTQVVLQGAPVSSGSRWDTVVMRRDWQPPAGESAFVLVQGSTSQTIAAGRLNAPGVEDDQPIALVRFTAGQTAPTQIVDLRCWSGNAGLIAASTDALAYLDRLGSRVRVGGDHWSRVIDGQGSPAWVREPGAALVRQLVGLDGSWLSQLSITQEPTATGFKMTMQGRIIRTGNAYTLGQQYIGIGQTSYPSSMRPNIGPADIVTSGTFGVEGPPVALLLSSTGQVSIRCLQGSQPFGPGSFIDIQTAVWYRDV